jgi:ATP-dependent RNA helicase DeaD
VLFAINWGERSGAATNRILGHICRRGEIQSRSVGAIEIGESASTFEIEANAAAGFEARVRRPDTRDPRLRIVRAGSQRSGGRPAGRPAPRSSWKSGSKRKPQR